MGDDKLIITGDEYFRTGLAELVSKEGDEFPFCEWTGLAIIYPEHDLLWISSGSDKTERFKTLENFEKEFPSLPRWEATRYVVLEIPDCFDGDPDADGEICVLDCALLFFDSRTGQKLNDLYGKPVPGREAEVERLRRSIELMTRGEHYDF